MAGIMRNIVSAAFNSGGRRPTPEGRKRALEASQQLVESQQRAAQKIIEAAEAGQHNTATRAGRACLEFAYQTVKTMAPHSSSTIGSPAENIAGDYMSPAMQRAYDRGVADAAAAEQQ